MFSFSFFQSSETTFSSSMYHYEVDSYISFTHFIQSSTHLIEEKCHANLAIWLGKRTSRVGESPLCEDVETESACLITFWTENVLTKSTFTIVEITFYCFLR